MPDWRRVYQELAAADQKFPPDFVSEMSEAFAVYDKVDRAPDFWSKY